MGSNSEAALLLGLFLSLIASSTCVAWIANNYASSPPCTYGTACAPIDLRFGTIEGQYVSTVSDYTNASGYMPNVTVVAADSWIFGSGTWERTDAGYILTEPAPWGSTDAQLILRNIAPVNGIYKVDYYVNNSAGNPFFITPRRTFGAGGTVYDIRIVIDSDGVHVLKYPAPLVGPVQDLYYVPMPNFQVTNAGLLGSKYEVSYDDSLNQVTIIKDDGSGGSVAFSGLPDVPSTETGFWYGGIGAYDAGLTIPRTDETVSESAGNDMTDSGSILSNVWDRIIAMSNAVVPGSDRILQFLSVVLRVLTWTLPDAIFPLWLSMILIGPQEVAILYLVARLVRGGG